MKLNSIIALLSILSFVVSESSKFKVDGMTCVGGCAFKVNNITQKIDGVKSCDVDFEKGILTVDFDPEKVNNDLIVKTLSEKDDIPSNIFLTSDLMHSKTIDFYLDAIDKNS